MYWGYFRLIDVTPPNSGRSVISFIRWIDGKNAFLRPTSVNLAVSFSTAIISSISATLAAGGFSIHAQAPARIQSMASGG